MEAIAALSLACNVIQIIGVGNNVIEAIYQIYKYGTSIDNAHLEESVERLRSLLTATTASTTTTNTSNNALTSTQATTDTQLQRVADGCRRTAQRLIDELSFLKGQGQGQGKRDAIKKGFLAMRRKGEIEKLKANLVDQERLLNTGILLRLKEETDAATITLRSDFKDLNQTLQVFIDDLGKGNVQVQDLLVAEAVSTRQHVSLEHENTRAFVRDMYTRTVTERQREKFLASLKFSSMNARRNQISSQYPQTFEWIFESRPEWSSFPDWLTEGVGTYFVEGKAASGKSTLMKSIAEDARTDALLRQWAPTTRIVSHYFWLAGEPLQRNLQGLFLSLVYQLLLENDDVLVETLSFEKEVPSDWSLTELSGLLDRLMSSGHYCIFLDGLDEYDDNLEKLADLLETLATQSNVKLCISSRPDKFYLHQVQPYSVIRLQELTKADIRQYVILRLTEAQKRGQFIATEGQEEIVGEFVVKADGVFLWVCLALDSVLRGIRSQASMTELQARIDQLPNDVVRLYENMLDRMGDDWSLVRAEAALYFRIFLCPTISGSYHVNHTRGSGAKLYQYAVILNRFNGISESDLTETVFVNEVYRVANRITNVCAGFLHVEQPTTETDQEWLALIKTNRGLETLARKHSHKFHDVANLSVFCTHRTAYDFLVQQPKGRLLTEACNISNFELWRFSLEARNLFARWRGASFSWADVINAVLELNKLEFQGGLSSPYHIFDTLKYIRRCLAEGLHSEQQRHLKEGDQSSNSRDGASRLYHFDHSKVDLDPRTTGNLIYPYRQICAIDFMGLTLEATRTEYFQHLLEPHFREGHCGSPLTQEYLDYLLFCASRSLYRYLPNVIGARADGRIHAVVKLLLDAGAKLYTEFFLPVQGTKQFYRLTAATHLLYSHRALACGFHKATWPGTTKPYPRGFLVFIPPSSFSTIGTRQFNLSARLYMEVNVPDQSTVPLTESDTRAQIVSGHILVPKDPWRLEKQIVLIAPADNLKDAWKVSIRESADLLSFIDKWRSIQGSDARSEDEDRAYRRQFNEMVDDICVRAEHVDVERYLREEGYLKDSPDPAVMHGIARRFKESADTSIMPEW